MSRTSLVLTVAAGCAAGLCLASTASAQTAERDSRALAAYLTPNTTPMPPCGNYSNEPPWSAVGKVVRVVIRNDFDPAKPKRKVKHKDPNSNNPADELSGDETEPGTRNDWGGVHTEGKRPFHVDLTQFTPVKGYYVQIRVVLKAHDRFKFFDNSKIAKPEDVITGVGAGDKQGKLCGAHFVDRTDGKPPVVAFYVLMNSAGAITYTPYNIGLVPNDDEETPFFVDPNIKNYG